MSQMFQIFISVKTATNFVVAQPIYCPLLWQALRDEFDSVPKLTKEQFFASGFAEQKMLLVLNVVTLTVAKHVELTKGRRKDENKTSEHRKKGALNDDDTHVQNVSSV